MTKTTITIRRPNGDIERVERPGSIAVPLQHKMREATREAGKGEILSFDTVTATPKAWPSRHCCAQWTHDQGCPLHGDRE